MTISKKKRSQLFGSVVSKKINKTIIFTFILIFGWIITGIIFQCSDRWLIVTSNSITIISLLIIFLVQKKLYKDLSLIQIKLVKLVERNELTNNESKSNENINEEEMVKAHFDLVM